MESYSLKISKEVEIVLNRAAALANEMKHEYVTPEHLIYALTENEKFITAFERCGGDFAVLQKELKEYLKKNLEELPKVTSMAVSAGFNQVLSTAALQADGCGKQVMELPHLVYGIFQLKDSFGVYYMQKQGVDLVSLLYELNGEEEIETEEMEEETQTDNFLKKCTVCLNDIVDSQSPLIGREEELERTMQVLCRRYKNNPLHIGEAGVGKTAITYGLARRIKDGLVPDKLKDAEIFSFDLGGLLAGTQFRGDFEKRLKELMESLKKRKNPILYIDEIHNLVGAGSVSGGSLDASNLLKPYLTSGEIRFIGATTYEEYKKYFSKNKSLVRRFQNIDVKEPSIKEATEILKGVQKYYEQFHGVHYQKGVMEYAVELSDKYINERFLPDKAIDLIDEAGAYRVLHPEEKKIQTVDKKLVEEVLSKTMNIPKETVEKEEVEKLAVLEEKLKEKVFGQEEAVAQLSNAVKFSKAGLKEENKPISNLLFVGPTGVGKTEMVKTLADILGIHLIRFDMSEYAEKHTIAKLIGSPAGYVGYEEGGLLTEMVRKHPHAVLLLDEMEKAHPDVFNVLLQVMDYATLTDNQGRKTDFRNVILIMTSNAGADKAGKAALGFTGEERNEGAITDAVNRTFSPEFRNRLDRIIVFNPIDEKMAEQIVQKQINLLQEKMSEKEIVLSLSIEAKKYLKKKGLSREYGARQIQRVINTELKPLLVDEILFGKLKKGGICKIDYKGEKIIIEIEKTEKKKGGKKHESISAVSKMQHLPKS